MRKVIGLAKFLAIKQTLNKARKKERTKSKACRKFRRTGKLKFFRLSFGDCISCVNNCYDLLTFISLFLSSNT